ncbi:MAG: helix-turn-helix domain-containing protein [Tagaea sp.]|jgi:transcriptional regulator with XRE-family HTH domain|nr:helix-turn-helix transcriptional regulator [Azospirillum sp.]MCA3265901.1 helix-turn-helix transcriptional regulator [Azospirillum sp.]MCZ8121795.1 helix-turn-helix transcriptional regulator [Magnetospirillum sp.]
MTPFGAKVRSLRRARGITMKRMAGDLEISQAFLSALEHGHRGRPSPALLVQICEYFHLIWDEYEEMHRLARLSHPRVVVDTRGLDPARTELANLLADKIADLEQDTVDALLKRLKNAQPVAKRPRTRAL